MNIQHSTFNIEHRRGGNAAVRWMLSVECWALNVFLIVFFFTFAAAAAPGVVDTTSSPFAKVQSVGLAEAHWTRGFWADRFDLCRTQMVPSMARLMQGTNYSQFYYNFEIAAGLVEWQAARRDVQ